MSYDAKAAAPVSIPGDSGDRRLANTSGELLDRAKRGDRDALDELFARYVTPLRHWASGRLPRWIRDIADTTDLVQDTLLQTFRRIERFEPTRDGALLAYLRQAVRNRVRLEFRQRRRQPLRVDLDSQQPAREPSPLAHAVAAGLFEDYQAALSRLRRDERDLIVARIELDKSYAEIAADTDRPNANAARSAVVRALVRLGEEMQRDE